MSFKQQFSSKLLILIVLVITSCSSSDDSSDPCPAVNNYGDMLIEAPDFQVYSYNNLTYSYIDREGVNDDGNFVYQFIYSNYDIQDATQVEEGYFLKFRITTPDDIPDGTFTLTDTTKMISDVETFYDYTVGGAIGRIDVTSMTVTFSNFDSCLNHQMEINFSDNDFFPGTIGNGLFNGKSSLYTIE